MVASPFGATASTLAAQFHLFGMPAGTPRYHIARTLELLVVLQDPATANRQARRHRWSLIPSWAKDPTIGNQLINAQGETAATEPAFRVAFRKWRCLILTHGLYERKRQDPQKQHFYVPPNY